MIPKPAKPVKKVKKAKPDKVKPKRKLVLESTRILDMARNPAILAEFPFLKEVAKAAKATPTNCPPCQARKSAGRVASAIASAKQTLAGLASDRAQKLNELLGTRELSIVFRNNSGKIEERTLSGPPNQA